MSFADRFDQTKKTEFKDAAKLAADHNTSKLRHAVMEQPCSGEQAAPVLYYDSTKAKRRTGRVPTNRDNPANRRRRWLKFQPSFDQGEYIDSEDLFRGMSDFQSPLHDNQAAAVRRFIDEDVILEGMFGLAYEGELGSKPIAFPNSQVIAADVTATGSTVSGLNLAKLKRSRKMFASHKHDLDKEDIYIAVTADQIDDLSNEIELKSKDYQEEAGPQFSRTGKLTKVWNHVFIEYQNLTTKTSGGNLLQRVPAWLKSTYALGVWQDVNSETIADSSRRGELYMWAEANMDGRRLDETGVVEIECLLDNT